MKMSRIRQVRWSIVAHWLIAAFSVIAILGMATPNCMQTVSFGEAIWYMRPESRTLPLLLFVLSETVLIYAFQASIPGSSSRLLTAAGGTLSAAGILIIDDSSLPGAAVAILMSPFEPLAIARGVPGFEWAEGHVMGAAFGLWVWLWAVLGIREKWRGTTTKSSLQDDPRGRGSSCG